jgi:hypothetical protein
MTNDNICINDIRFEHLQKLFVANHTKKFLINRKIEVIKLAVFSQKRNLTYYL